VADTGTEVVTQKPQAVVETVKTFVYKNLKTIESAMPRVGLTAESVARTALSQVYRNPVLETCDKVSLIRSIIEAASLGLSFALGRAYLVPFNNKHTDPLTGRESWRMEAQFMPGYQGLVDLVRRSAQVKTVLAGAAYQGDTFVYEFGLETDRFEHKPIVEPDDALLTHAYCLIRFLDGGYQLVVLTKAQIDAVRARSKAAKNGPWVTDYGAMAIKTAVKRCTKLCPASIELSRAIELDNAAEMGERQQLAVDIPIVGDEPAQITAGETTAIEAPKPTVTQQVTEKISDVLKIAREATPPRAEDAPPPATTGPGRGRPPKCPVCKTNSLKTVVEREQEKCDDCRQKETGAIRDAQGTSVAAHDAEAGGETPVIASEPEPDAVDKLVQRLRFQFMVDSQGNLPEAEISLSQLTKGKVQKFEKLADYLRATPEMITVVTEALAK
jgi:recombination protein RecT